MDKGFKSLPAGVKQEKRHGAHNRTAHTGNLHRLPALVDELQNRLLGRQGGEPQACARGLATMLQTAWPVHSVRQRFCDEFAVTGLSDDSG